MEAASEKPRRGRPQLISAAGRELVAQLNPHVRTERGANNRFYAMIALNALTHCEEREAARMSGVNGSNSKEFPYAWLAPDGSAAGLIPGFSTTEWAQRARVSVLAELGRVQIEFGDEVMRDIARQVCALEPKPATKEAAAMVRRWRLQGRAKSLPEGTLDGLMDAISHVIDHYVSTHTDPGRAVIIEALEWTLSLVEDLESADGDDDH